jgi:hypothetical protein
LCVSRGYVPQIGTTLHDAIRRYRQHIERIQVAHAQKRSWIKVGNWIVITGVAASKQIKALEGPS